MTVIIDSIEYNEDHLRPQRTAHQFGVESVSRLDNGSIVIDDLIALRSRREIIDAYESSNGWSYHYPGGCSSEMLVCRNRVVIAHLNQSQWIRFCDLLTTAAYENTLDDMRYSIDADT